MTQAYYRRTLATLSPSLRAILVRKATQPKRIWCGMTTWVPTHAPNLWGHPPWAFPALFTCHACRSRLERDPYESSLSQWLFDGRAYYRPTPHARIPRDLGLSLLLTGMWLENHLFRSIFTVGVPRPEACTPYLDVAPSSASLTCEPSETPPCLTEHPSRPSLRGPTMTSVNARVRGPVGTILLIDQDKKGIYLSFKLFQQ